jgi:hypothetical protein
MENQLRYWRRVVDRYGINLEHYIRDAVDRAMALDLDQEDPKWKKFNEATRAQQEKILGLTFKDKDMRDYLRYQVLMSKVHDMEGMKHGDQTT